MDVPSTLLVTNDYPPRVGGIQRTLEALVKRFPPDKIGVLAPRAEPARVFDDEAPYRIFRRDENFMRPGPRTLRAVFRAVEQMAAEVVLFGATYPLGLLGPRVAKEGVPYVCAAHGFEYWLSLLPGTNMAMRHATSKASRVAVMCSEFVARTVRMAVPEPVPVSVLRPGADLEMFHPDVDGSDVRSRFGLEDRPVIVCVSRLVERKGQDVLIKAMPAVRRRVRDAALLIVGNGPQRRQLEAMARESNGSVFFAGEVSEAELAIHYKAGDIFAMPCRSRLGGLEVEGWGNVFIEAAACGMPVVAGDSGGAREALIDGETGFLVNGSDVSEVASACVRLLVDRNLAQKMGAAGRDRVEREHSWPRVAARLAVWLRQAAVGMSFTTT